MSILGLDISNNNATVDLARVQAAGFQFMAHKATEGNFFHDALFPARWARARQLGLVRIAYHFSRPDLTSPEDELAFFLDYVGNQPGGLQVGDCLALDSEMAAAAIHLWFRQRREVQHELRGVLRTVKDPFPDPGRLQIQTAPVGAPNMTAWARNFLTDALRQTGIGPFLYSGLWFLGPNGMLGDPVLGQFGLWYGYWAGTMPQPPAGWDFVAIWQNSGSGSVPGVLGACDTDLFNGTLDQLKLYGLQAPTKPQLTNDDRVQCIRYIIADPPDLSGLQNYIGRFV